MTEGTEMDVDISPLPDAEPDAGYAMDADDIARESAMMELAQEISGTPSLVDAQPDEAYHGERAAPAHGERLADEAYRAWMAEQEHNAVVRRQPKITRLLWCRRAGHRRHARRNRGHHRGSTARAPADAGDGPPDPLPGSDEVARTVSFARQASGQRFHDVDTQPFTTPPPVVWAVAGSRPEGRE